MTLTSTASTASAIATASTAARIATAATMTSSSIVLATINARYHHASMGLRYLKANMGDLKDNTHIVEFVLQSRPLDIAEQILMLNPDIVGFGVYIWNIEETSKVVSELKTLKPELVIILGGPEVSYETEQQNICQMADYVVTGWGEVSLPWLVRAIYQGNPPSDKVIKGEQPPLDSIAMPYLEYTAEDIANRTIYVEASRGCPFKCEFCLSALDETAWPFDLTVFLQQMDALYARGLRQFKFVDRTFNIKPETGRAILDFFLHKIATHPTDPVFVHFEVIPDHLPDLLKQAIAQFPPHSLQFELGLQTLNPQVQKNISRRTNLVKAQANIEWLMTNSQAHLHVDLIAGLPGEDMASFAEGFDRLWSWQPHEIQLGVLKRLRGTPVIRHTQAFDMRYSQLPPYTVLSTNSWSFEQLQWFGRFARFWDLVANSGRFSHSIQAIMSVNASPFAAFASLVDFAYAHLGVTYQIALERLALTIGLWLQMHYDSDTFTQQLLPLLQADFAAGGQKGDIGLKLQTYQQANPTTATSHGQSRQQRHNKH